MLHDELPHELEEIVDALAARADVLIRQLGITPADAPAAGPCPGEIATTLKRTLALPEIRELRPRIVPELSVLAPAGDGESITAVAGFADAIALDEAQQPDAVLDWKSDVSPDERTRRWYRHQVSQYAQALGAKRGAVVYMTLGQVDWVVV